MPGIFGINLSKDPADAARVPGGDLGTRQAYLKYVDSMQSNGQQVVPYDQWKMQLVQQLSQPAAPTQPMPSAPSMPLPVK